MSRFNKHPVFAKILISVLSIAIAAPFAFPVMADASQNKNREIPVTNFNELAIGTDPQTLGTDRMPYNRILSDLFYIDYPGSWRFGTNEYCPFIFFHKTPEQESVSNEFQDFYDEKLNGDPAQVAAYVESGGINTYLQQVLGTPITSEYQLVPDTKEDIVLVYRLEKGGSTQASIIIWTFGKLSIRAENISVPYNPATDRGSILLFPEWDTTDFSSPEAIQTYVSADNLDFYMEPFIEGTPVWTSSTYKTAFHDYMYYVGETDNYRAAVYIPITPAGHKNWIVAFQVDKGSGMADNAFDMRELFIPTFQALK